MQNAASHFAERFDVTLGREFAQSKLFGTMFYGWERPLENFLMLICKCVYTLNPAFGRVDTDARGPCWRAELQNIF